MLIIYKFPRILDLTPPLLLPLLPFPSQTKEIERQRGPGGKVIYSATREEVTI